MKLSWNSEACSHSGNCVKGHPEVFQVVDGKFVIDESAGSEEALQQAIANCPSGALASST